VNSPDRGGAAVGAVQGGRSPGPVSVVLSVVVV
jgi:hypothetical protein